MVLEPLRVRLFVDGKLVQERAVPAVTATAVPGELGIGRTVEPGTGCDGLVDDVRISAAFVTSKFRRTIPLHKG